MNNTLAYFSNRYNNSALWYLALFAKTPHPFNREGSGRTEQEALEAIKQAETLADVGYTPTQAQAIQRKQILRPQSLGLDKANDVMPEVANSRVLEGAYKTMRNPKIREANNDIAALDRYRRSLANQLSEAEKSMPILSPEEAEIAKKRLATLAPEDWDSLDTTYESVNQIRKQAQPVTANISDRSSPIGRGAKRDATRQLDQRQRALEREVNTTGIDPRTGQPSNLDTVRRGSANPLSPPAYVANPESIEYVTNPTNQASLNKNMPMDVAYTPSVPSSKTTGLDRRIAKIKRVRQYLEDDKKAQVPVIPPTATPTPLVPPSIPEDKFNKAAQEEVIRRNIVNDKATPEEFKQAVDALKKQPVADRPIDALPKTPPVEPVKSESVTTPPKVETTSPIPPTTETPKTPKTAKGRKPKTDAEEIAETLEKVKKTTKTGEQTATRVKDVKEKTPSKLKQIFSNGLNFSERQKRGLRKVGLGLAGAAGILGGGTLIANSMAKKRQEDELARQRQMYTSQPPSYPVNNIPNYPPYPPY